MCVSAIYGAERIFFEPLVKIMDVSIYTDKSGSGWQFRSGSLKGGTPIYIKLTGHSLSADDNQVFIGPYPCLIPLKGVN